MEGILQQVDGHFQVSLPWRYDPPYKLNNTAMAERRALFLKRCLMKDEEFLRRYRTTVNDFIERRNVERVPEEELNTRDKPAWYRPYYPVKHLLKPGKVRVVHDCAAKFGQTALVVADIEAMFDQFLVDRKDCDIF